MCNNFHNFYPQNLAFPYLSTRCHCRQTNHEQSKLTATKLLLNHKMAEQSNNTKPHSCPLRNVFNKTVCFVLPFILICSKIKVLATIVYFYCLV